MKKLAAHLWSDQSGASAIELALVATFLLVPLMLGATELGRRIWINSELDNAVRVGMEYVMANYLAGSISGTSLQNAVRAGTSMGTAVTVSPPSACGSAYSCFGCPTSSAATLTTSPTNSPPGRTPGTYAGLIMSYSYTLVQGRGHLLPALFCASTATTLSTSIVDRIQ
jgi:Flp pilus assembly pilin Flp